VKRIAINGFGRIGRLVFRILEKRTDIRVVAINDLSTPEELAYLLKYDTNHRRYDKKVTFDDNAIYVNNRKIQVFKEMDPSNLPWKKLNIDIVLECTGKFTSYEKAMLHVSAGAKKVLISAPGKGEMKTVVYNVNDNILKDSDIIVSAASCTTNCLAPVLKVLDDTFGIVKGNMTTIHAYTNDQVTLDVTHSKGIMERRGRACAMNMVPTSTGAAKAIGKVLPKLDGKILGTAIRVPVSDGSLIDVVVELKKKVTKEKVNEAFKKKVNETLHYTEDPIVSSDIISSTCGATVDGNLTDVLTVDDKQLVHVVAWYDNEMGYSYQMVRTFLKM
jgi:glyceraldehyde 3-phosphate dehydrogenase